MNRNTELSSSPTTAQGKPSVADNDPLQTRVAVLEEGLEIRDEQLNGLSHDLKVLLVEINIICDWIKDTFGMRLINKDSQIYKQIHDFDEIQDLKQTLTLNETVQSTGDSNNSAPDEFKWSTSTSFTDRQDQDQELQIKQCWTLSSAAAAEHDHNVIRAGRGHISEESASASQFDEQRSQSPTSESELSESLDLNRALEPHESDSPHPCTSALSAKCYNCQYCGKELVGRRNLKNHMKQVHHGQGRTAGLKLLICKYCNEPFESVPEMMCHQRDMHHLGKNVKSTSEPDPDPLAMSSVSDNSRSSSHADPEVYVFKNHLGKRLNLSSDFPDRLSSLASDNSNSNAADTDGDGLYVFKPIEGTTSFISKLWGIVNDPATNRIISWSRSGSKLIIYNQAKFAGDLLPLHFKHNNFSSFVRQLNFYGFRKEQVIDQSKKNQVRFAHKLFRRGREDLVALIKRITTPSASNLSLHNIQNSSRHVSHSHGHRRSPINISEPGSEGQGAYSVTVVMVGSSDEDET